MIPGLERLAAEGTVLLTTGKTMKPAVRSDVDVAAQELECSLCPWQQNWICEHMHAKCCSGAQRKIGGLKEAIRRVGFECPIRGQKRTNTN